MKSALVSLFLPLVHRDKTSPHESCSEVLINDVLFYPTCWLRAWPRTEVTCLVSSGVKKPTNDTPPGLRTILCESFSRNRKKRTQRPQHSRGQKPHSRDNSSSFPAVLASRGPSRVVHMTRHYQQRKSEPCTLRTVTGGKEPL